MTRGNRGGIVWTTPPEQLARNITAYGDKVLTAVYAVAEYCAQAIQDDAKQNAPWQDRTSNARKMLQGEVDKLAEDVIAIYLIHGMDYGKWLELCNGGKYKIVMPTLEAHYNRVMTMLRSVLR